MRRKREKGLDIGGVDVDLGAGRLRGGGKQSFVVPRTFPLGQRNREGFDPCTSDWGMRFEMKENSSEWSFLSLMKSE